MAGVNKVILIGNLGKDPDVRSLENGTKVATFSLATNEVYKDKDGNKKEITDWHNIVVWRGLADLAEKYLRKGNQIYLEGKLKSRSYDDKDGSKKYITEVVVDNMTFLGKPSDSQGGSYEHSSVPAPSEGNVQEQFEDDLPF